MRNRDSRKTEEIREELRGGIDVSELRTKKIAELTSIAKQLGITNFANLRKQELIVQIMEASTLGAPRNTEVIPDEVEEDKTEEK